MATPPPGRPHTTKELDLRGKFYRSQQRGIPLCACVWKAPQGNAKTGSLKVELATPQQTYSSTRRIRLPQAAHLSDPDLRDFHLQSKEVEYVDPQCQVMVCPGCNADTYPAGTPGQICREGNGFSDIRPVYCLKCPFYVQGKLCICNKKSGGCGREYC